MSTSAWLTFEKSLTVATFIGGISLGVLTFLIQLDVTKMTDFRAPFLTNQIYKEILILVTGTGGTLLILSVFAIKIVIVDKMDKPTWFPRLALKTYESGLGVLLALLPLLVAPFSKGSALFIVIIIVCGLIIGYFEKRKKSRMRKQLKQNLFEFD